MVFNTEYFSTLDRGFYQKSDGYAKEVDFPESVEQQTNLTLREIGTTADANVNPIQAVQAKIREGVARIEIPFFGAGKGGFGGQNSTPEILGRLEREQLRELAKINQTKISTHATTNISGLSGLTREGFTDDRVQETLKEINKAIEFAANATTGGAVVFHVNEWERPIMDSDKNGRFKQYETEDQKAPIYLADEKTGKVTAISRDMKFYFPEEEYDPKTGMRYVKLKPDGSPDVREKDFRQALEHIKEKHKDDKELIDSKTGKMKSEGEILLYGYYEQQRNQARGEMYRFISNVEEDKKMLKKVVDAKAFAKKLWDSTPKNERWKLVESVGDVRDLFIPGDNKNILERLDDAERRYRQSLEGHQAIVTAAQEKYEEVVNQQNRFKPIEQVGMERTAKSIATVGIKAMIETQRNKKYLDEAIFVSPEGYEPGSYGAHPDELRKIVEESRKAMSAQLVKEGYSREQAMEKAKTHIRATIDTGHMNMWKQHFVAKPGETPEQRDARYKKWYLEQAEKLGKDGIIGQVHVSDNWGYDDEHLTAGQGNAPIKDFVKVMEKYGVKSFIAERGSFNAQTIMTDTLAELGSPVYALGGRRFNASQMRHAHFGYNAPANYIVGAYAPSNDWRLWSEVPLE